MRFVDPGEGYLACGWIGKGRLAEPDEIVEAAEQRAAAVGIAARTHRGRHGRSDLRGHRRGALHRQPLERQDGLRDCRRGGAARRAGRARFRPVALRRCRRVSRWCAVRQRGRDARAPCRSMPPRRTSSSWRRPSPTTRPDGGAAAGKIEKADGPLTLRAGADAGHPRRARRRARRRRPPGARRLRGRERRPGRARPRQARAQGGRPDRRQRHLAPSAAASTPTTTPSRSSAATATRRWPLAPKAALAARILDRAERPARADHAVAGTHADRQSPSATPSNQLAEHLRFYESSGVTGVSRDASVARRARPAPSREPAPTLARPTRRPRPRRPAATARAAAGRPLRAIPAEVLADDPRGHRRLHALQAAHARAARRSSSASATRRPS